MSTLKHEAFKIIEGMQEDIMGQVITYLRNFSEEKKQSSKSLEGYQTLQSFAGILSADSSSSAIPAITPTDFIQKFHKDL